MQKKISLLYKDREAGPIKKSAENAVYNLNIDRMTENACESKKHTGYFLSVLCRENGGCGEARYRAEILRDFLAFPTLLSEMSQLFKGYDNLMNETEEVLKEVFRYGLPASVSGSVDCTYEELYINAHYARNVIAYFSEILELFSRYEVKSEGLLSMKNFCVSINESKCISEIEKAAEHFRNENPEKYRFAVDIALDRAMRVRSCSVADASDASKREKKGLLSVFKKKNTVICELGSSALENSGNMLAAAMGELSDIFSDLANGIYSVFRGLSEELMFYHVALCIEKRLREHGMGYCFPEVLPKESDTLSAEGIYDLLLLCEGKGKDEIVTNDVCLSKSILAKGDNNCGKTSFLRAVGSSVLFAQNGLFVCAEKMTVSVRSSVFTHFSSAEKDFSDNDAAGRFEGEVKEIARIINELTPYSLILLNETFQTTAYREGAKGIKEILDILPELRCKYIFVTHMKAIFPLFGKDEVSVLTADRFKLVNLRQE